MLVAVLATAGCASTDSAAHALAPASTRVTSSPGASLAAGVRTRFDDAVRGQLAKRPKSGGEAITKALVAAGFSRSGMQVTADRTTVGLAVPSVQFAVRWQGECLIGQSGPGAGEYTSQLAAPVDGSCLLGATRPITW